MEQTTVRKGPGRPSKAAEVDTTPFHEHRLEQAEKQKIQEPVKDTWYEWVRRPDYDPERGKKLIRVQLTATGTTSEWIGWEKKIDKAFLESIRGQIRDKKVD